MKLRTEIVSREKVDIYHQHYHIALCYPISNKLVIDLHSGNPRQEEIISFVSRKFQVPHTELFVTTSADWKR